MLALGAEHGGLGAHLAPVPAVQCTVQYSTVQYSTVQYLPVLATLSCARWRCVALLRLVSMLTPGRANTATAGLLEGRYREISRPPCNTQLELQTRVAEDYATEKAPSRDTKVLRDGRVG